MSQLKKVTFLYVTFCFCLVINVSGWYASNTLVTECDTPDSKPGYCIGIKQCNSLLRKVSAKDAYSFLNGYRCGPRNENPFNPMVCCANITPKKTSRNKAKFNNIFPKSCGRQKVILENRIIGGMEASLGEYPWMARLIHKHAFGYTSFGCAGFLIHPRFVITAAHCTHLFHTRVRGPIEVVELGEHNTETEIDCSHQRRLCAERKQVLRVARVFTHKGYDPKIMGQYNDIAIIYLKEKARLTNFVQPICLIKGQVQIPARYYLSGWGRTKKEIFSKIKMKVEIPPFDKEKCKKIYSRSNIHLRDSQICAGGEPQRDSCTGDSGGPLMMPTDDEIWHASGIVSFGMGCGESGWPGVYTNVTKFLPWIKSRMVRTMRNRLKKKKLHDKKNINKINTAI